MLTVYKKRKIPKNMELVTLNDVFFNKYTVEILDEKAKPIISAIDHSEMIDRYMIKSRFDKGILNVDKLSTGCKTALNILYNPLKVFDICECGENALDVIYTFPEGNISCEYPLISFDMTSVLVYEKKKTREVSDYDELKEWWMDEN